jgi:hypothetical protein
MDITERIGEQLKDQGIRAWACSHKSDLNIDMGEVNNIYCMMQQEVDGVPVTIFVFENGKITVTGPSDQWLVAVTPNVRMPDPSQYASKVRPETCWTFTNVANIST